MYDLHCRGDDCIVIRLFARSGLKGFAEKAFKKSGPLEATDFDFGRNEKLPLLSLLCCYYCDAVGLAWPLRV